MFEFVGIIVSGIALGIAIVVCFSAYYTFVKLPEQQRDILSTYSLCVINHVSLQYSMLDEEQQKQIAEEKMRGIFNDYNVALPGTVAIESSLADALYKRKREEYCIRFDPTPITPELEAA